MISVPLIGMLLLITNNKKIMGTHTNNKLTNIVGIITFVIMGLAGLGTILTFFHP